MARVLRYDGILPQIRKPVPDGSGHNFTKAEPDDIRRIAADFAVTVEDGLHGRPSPLQMLPGCRSA